MDSCMYAANTFLLFDKINNKPIKCANSYLFLYRLLINVINFVLFLKSNKILLFFFVIVFHHILSSFFIQGPHNMQNIKNVLPANRKENIFLHRKLLVWKV